MEEQVWVLMGPIAHYGMISDGNTDTQRVIAEEMTSLLDWIKATVRSVHPDKGHCAQFL